MFDPYNDTELNDYSGGHGSTTMNDNWLSDFLKAGAQVGGSYLNRNNQPTRPVVTAPAAKTNWLPFAALGGVVLLLIVGLIALRPRS